MLEAMIENIRMKLSGVLVMMFQGMKSFEKYC